MKIIARSLPIVFAAAVMAATSAEAKSNTTWNWGTNGSGSCIAVDGVNKFFTPTNCQITVGPWWSARGVALTTKWIPCNTAYYNNLEAWNYEKLSGAVPIHGIYGIAYQSDSSAFTWDDFDIMLPLQNQKNTPASPGSGGVGLQNWNTATRHFQGAVSCLNADSPTKPTTARATSPNLVYDFGEWETTIRLDENRVRLVRQVALAEGKRLDVRLRCPAGMVRGGGVEYGYGHAVEERPHPDVAATTDIEFTASPQRGGANVRLKPNRLGYPTVVQLAMTCKRLAPD